ncbi:MAG: peptidylprolyl isomerase [Bacteroidaceae bacterium]|nr:peptidylprolyl isomerase [Bacteroidaceae bacterium]MBR5891991.1 peptidylprolyl isomerase [Bacteroidaceae bacterium]
MKKNFLLGLMLLAAGFMFAQSTDPVLFKVGDTEITKSEFEYALNKNNTATGGNAKSAKEYLPMYIDFKLKVVEAKALGLDTLSSFIDEFKADRARQAEEYLLDKEYVEREAHKLYAKDSATVGRDGFLKVSHIMFPMRQDAPAEFLVATKAKADSAYQMLNAGVDFAAVAQRYMGDRPDTFEILRGEAYKEFEEAAYALKNGGFSHPVLSPGGIHIIKRISHRPFGSYKEYRPAIMSILEKRNVKLVARYRLGYQLAKNMAPGTTPEQALAREDSLLETKYPEFGNLMREYRDGLLFFEVSNREVWQKAANDEAALEKFFKKNKKKYKFDSPRFRGAVIYANSEEDIKKAQELLKNVSADDYKAIVEQNFTQDSVCTIRLEAGVFPIGENGWVDKEVFGQGKGGRMKRGYKMAGVVGTVLKKKPETYKDVKGAVVSDYQQQLEKEWMKNLRKKYSVQVYEDVLKTVNKY